MSELPEIIKAALKLTFSGGGSSLQEFEAEEEFPGPRNASGEERFWKHLLQELKREPSFGKFYDELPDISALADRSDEQSLSMTDFNIDRYFDWRNTHHAWLEIHNLLISTKYNLVESRAYKALEGLPGESANDLKIPYLLHIKKMDCFKLATLNMVRIEDLLLLLIFENLGASLISVDFEKHDWQKHITWKNLRDALKKQRQTHEHLKALSQNDYDSLMRILEEFKNPQFVNAFVEFRDRMTHRFSPSVDYAQMYFSPEKRTAKVVKNASGQMSKEYRIFGTPQKPNYEFLKLYELATKTFAHWVALLGRLRAIPRFRPNATISLP